MLCKRNVREVSGHMLTLCVLNNYFSAMQKIDSDSESDFVLNVRKQIIFMNCVLYTTENRGSQWYAQFANWAHTGHENGKCGFCGRFQARPIYPHLAVGGRVMPTGPTHVTKMGNVGSVGVFRASHLTTFGTRGQGNALRGS